MGNTITIGKTGSGKSLFATHIIETQLIGDTRPIVTNITFDLNELNAYMQSQHPDWKDSVFNRIFLIKTPTLWWRRRVEDGKLIKIKEPFPTPPPDADDDWELPEGSIWRTVGGVIYHMDEVQTTHNAREWGKRGTETTNYLTQHRKLKDDNNMIAPAAALLDRQLRTCANECIVLNNWYKLNLGPMTAPRKIYWRRYQNCPPERGETPTKTGFIEIDPEKLAKCYKTEAGVGIMGIQGADKGDIAKGIPWWTIFVAIAMIGAGVWYGCHFLMHKYANKAGTAIASGMEPITKPLDKQLEKLPEKHPSITGLTDAQAPASKPPIKYERASVAVVPDKEILIRATGWSAKPIAMIELESGFNVFGTNLTQRGDTLWLDGLGYQLVPKKEKPAEPTPQVKDALTVQTNTMAPAATIGTSTTSMQPFVARPRVIGTFNTVK